MKLGGLAPSNLEIALLKQYPFDSAVQRMSVVAKKKGSPTYSVFIKGAPEKVASLCKPNTSKEPQSLENLVKDSFSAKRMVSTLSLLARGADQPTDFRMPKFFEA